MLTALLLIAARIARIPRGAIPLPPRWLWVSLATAAAVRLAAGGAPMLRIGHVEVGCGGLVDVVRLTALSLVILATSALVTWTTDIAEAAPATASWGRWPRAGRCPIEDWSVTVASPLRTLPMLIDELQVVKAVRQLRAKPTPRSRVHQLRLAANRRRRRPRHREDDGEFASSRLDHPSWRDRGVHHFGWQMMVHG
jgi:energy-coupling factor transport system permease protein